MLYTKNYKKVTSEKKEKVKKKQKNSVEMRKKSGEGAILYKKPCNSYIKTGLPFVRVEICRNFAAVKTG